MKRNFRRNLAENWQWSGLCLALFITAIYSRPLIPIDETRYLSACGQDVLAACDPEK